MEDSRLKNIEKVLGVSFPKDSIIYNFTVASGYNQFGEGPRYFVNTINCPILKLVRGQQYLFDLTDTSVSGYPLSFSQQPDGKNSKVDSEDFFNGITKYGKESTRLGYISVLIPEDEDSAGCFYYSNGNANAGNIVNFIDPISKTTVSTTTLEPVVKLPDMGRNDPSSIFCETQGSCVKPTGKGRRSDIRFNPPDYEFLDEFNPTTPPPPTSTTTTTTTTFAPDLNPYDQISYLTPSYVDNRLDVAVDKLNPDDFNITSVDSSAFTYGDYKAFAFYNNAQITIEYSGVEPDPFIDMEYFIIGGGGGGGEPGFGGGGGAGAVASGVTRVKPGTYVVIVGKGGEPNQFGENSSFNFNVAYGGGPGGTYLFPAVESNGSTGGAGGNSSSLATNPFVSSSDSFVNNGGGSTGSDFSGGGGGGGAGSPATNAQDDDESRFIGTNGGDGIVSDFLDGTNRYFAAGGGGGGSGILLTGQGGLGGGGSFSSPNGEDGTGSGGLGSNSSFDAQNAGSGGDGLVIIRYNTKPDKIFDPEAGDFLNIKDVFADKKKITVFFNPNNDKNNVDTYYLDFKKSSSTNFSPLKNFKSNSNVTYISADLPSYGSYDIRISVLHNGVTYSGPPVNIVLSETSNPPEIEISADSENNITANIINRFSHQNLFIEYSYDDNNWNRLYISNEASSINIPATEILNNSETVRFKVGKYIKEEEFIFNDIVEPITLNRLTKDELANPPDGTVESTNGGLIISFTPEADADGTFAIITNNETLETFKTVIENNQSAEQQSFVFTDSQAIKNDINSQSSYNVKLYSSNDFGIGNSSDLGNFQNEKIPTSIASPTISETSEPISRTNYKLVLIDTNSEIPISDIDHLQIIVEEDLLTVYPDEFSSNTVNGQKQITYYVNTENNLDVKNISVSLVYKGDTYSGSTPFSEEILFDPSLIEILPEQVQNFSLVPQQDLYDESYNFNLSWSEAADDRYELIVWVFKNSDDIPENDSTELLNADSTIIDLVNTNNFSYYYNKTIQEDSTFIFGIRSKNEWGVGPISYLRKSVNYIQPIGPATKLTINAVNKKVTLSWSPPSRLGSFKQLGGYRILYNKSSIDTNQIESVDISANSTNFTIDVPINGYYSFAISSFGYIEQGGSLKKYLGPVKFASIFVEGIDIKDAPTLNYVKFSDYDELEFSAEHANLNTDPAVSGYSIVYSTDDSRSDYTLTIPPIQPINQLKENDTDIITVKFPTVPDTRYSFSIVTNTEESVSKTSRTLSLVSPSGKRTPDPPSLRSYYQITNGIKIEIIPPEYTGWSTEYFTEKYDNINKYFVYYREKNTSDWEKLTFNPNQDFYYIVGLDPYKEYEIKLQSKNENYYSEISEIFDIGSPIQGLRIELDQNLNVVANGNDSENSYNNSVNPNFVFYYGQTVTIQYLIDSEVYFDDFPSFPYSTEIQSLKKNKNPPAKRSYSFSNSLSSLNVPETKILRTPAPGRYYYKSKSFNFSRINLNNFSYTIPSDYYLLVKALRVEPKLTSNNDYLSINIHGEDFADSNISKFKIVIRSSTRDQELSIDSNPTFFSQVVPIENEKKSQDLISVRVYAYDENDQFIVKSEDHFIQVYDFPHSISNLQATGFSLEGTCDALLISLDMSINTEVLDPNLSGKIIRSPVNTKYIYGACFYDEEPSIKQFVIEDSKGGSATVNVNLRESDGSYKNFNTSMFNSANVYSVNSSSTPPFLTNFVLSNLSSVEDRKLTYTMINSIDSSKTIEHDYLAPAYMASGVAFVCRYDVDSNKTSHQCVDFCSIKATDEVVSVFNFIDSGNTASMQCNNFPTESEEDKQLICDRLFNITTTTTTTTTTAPPEISTTIGIETTTTTTTTTPIPLGDLPEVVLPEYFSSIQDSNWEPSFFLPELTQNGTVQLTDVEVPVQIVQSSIAYNTKYIKSNSTLGAEELDTLTFGSIIVKGIITNSNVSYKTQKSKFPTADKTFYHCAGRTRYAVNGSSCLPDDEEILTSTLISYVYVDTESLEMIAATTYYKNVDENSSESYTSFILSKEYVEDIMSFLGISNVNDLGQGLDTGEIDGAYRSFPVIYREVTSRAIPGTEDDPKSVKTVSLKKSFITGIAMTYRTESSYNIQAFVEISIPDEDPIPLFVTADKFSGKFGYLTYPVPSVGIGFFDDVYVQNTSAGDPDACQGAAGFIRDKHIKITSDSAMDRAIFNFPIFTPSEEKSFSTIPSDKIAGRSYNIFIHNAGRITLPKQYNLPNVSDFDFSEINSSINTPGYPGTNPHPTVLALYKLKYSVFRDQNYQLVASKIVVSQNGNVSYNTILPNVDTSTPEKLSNAGNYISENLIGSYLNIQALRFNSSSLTTDVTFETLGAFGGVLRTYGGTCPSPECPQQSGTIQKV